MENNVFKAEFCNDLYTFSTVFFFLLWYKQNTKAGECMYNFYFKLSDKILLQNLMQKKLFYVKGAYLENGKRQSETDEKFGSQGLKQVTVITNFNNFILLNFHGFL